MVTHLNIRVRRVELEEQTPLDLIRPVPIEKYCGFAVNDDGTVSPLHAPHLVLGSSAPAMILVDTTIPSQGRYRCIFEHAALLTQNVRGVPLTLRDHPGLAITRIWSSPRQSEPKNKDTEGLSYCKLGIGPASEALRVSAPPGCSLLVNEADRMVLDVANILGSKRFFRGKAVILVGGASEEETFRRGISRDFVVNADGSISPKQAPNLAIGYCSNDSLSSDLAQDCKFYDEVTDYGFDHVAARISGMRAYPRGHELAEGGAAYSRDVFGRWGRHASNFALRCCRSGRGIFVFATEVPPLTTTATLRKPQPLQPP
jgi:hypothetical protein